MTIRSGRSPRPDSACFSADLLTGPERAASAHQIMPVEITRHKVGRGDKTWGDHPEIRAMLLTLRATL